MQVIWPVVSHFGHQLCPLPTALLSTHTGGFERFTFLDLSEEMERIITHWKELKLSFDAVYSGFLGSENQINIVESFIKDFSEEKTLILVDPVMGDNGEIYRTYTKGMCDGMKHLCGYADIITPNLTEAYILLGREYEDRSDIQSFYSMLDELLAISNKNKCAVIITGIRHAEQNTIGAVFAVKENDKITYGNSFAAYCDRFFPGSGDMFSSILLSKLLNGNQLKESVKTAVQFISGVSKHTRSLNTPYTYGLDFERLLGELQ